MKTSLVAPVGKAIGSVAGVGFGGTERWFENSFEVTSILSLVLPDVAVL